MAKLHARPSLQYRYEHYDPQERIATLQRVSLGQEVGRATHDSGPGGRYTPGPEYVST